MQPSGIGAPAGETSQKTKLKARVKRERERLCAEGEKRAPISLRAAKRDGGARRGARVVRLRALRAPWGKKLRCLNLFCWITKRIIFCALCQAPLAGFARKGPSKRPKPPQKNTISGTWYCRPLATSKSVAIFNAPGNLKIATLFLATRGDLAILASEGALRARLEISLFSRVVSR